jgi:two-component system, sensor histidine kinase and response regulator
MLNQSHTILAVDDEPINLRLMERLLRRHFTVLTANSGEEALEIVQHEDISLIITDQRMPGMQGTELLRKCMTVKPGMVSLVVTANNDTDTSIEAITNSGAIRVINKPWNPDQILKTIQDALAIYERGLQNRKMISQLKQVNENLEQLTRRR